MKHVWFASLIAGALFAACGPAGSQSSTQKDGAVQARPVPTKILLLTDAGHEAVVDAGDMVEVRLPAGAGGEWRQLGQSGDAGAMLVAGPLPVTDKDGKRFTARRIVIANPGAHVMPSLEVNAPYGLGKVYSGPEGDQALKRYLAQPLTIMLGEDDTELDPRDGAGAKAQGANRLQRGLSAFNTGKQLAESHGWQFNWRLIQIPDVGHSSKSMYAAPEAANVFAR